MWVCRKDYFEEIDGSFILFFICNYLNFFWAEFYFAFQWRVKNDVSITIQYRGCYYPKKYFSYFKLF